MFAKANGNYFSVQVLDGTNPATQFNLSTESTSDSNGATSTIEEFGNGWYRCTMKFTSAYTGVTTIRGITSTDTGGVYIYGWQLEAGSYPTSYIPTYGASVTRGADSCSKTGISSLIGQTEGTLYAEFNLDKFITGSTGRILAIGDNTSSNRIGVGISATNKLEGFVVASSSLVAYIQTSTLTELKTYKLALGYKENDFAFYVDGVQIGTDTSGGIPSGMDKVFLGLFEIGGVGSQPANGINQAILFETRLSNDELAALTS